MERGVARGTEHAGALAGAGGRAHMCVQVLEACTDAAVVP